MVAINKFSTLVSIVFIVGTNPCSWSMKNEPLIRMYEKKLKGGGEPGISLHMISQHVDITTIIAQVMTHSCSHMNA